MVKSYFLITDFDSRLNFIKSPFIQTSVLVSILKLYVPKLVNFLLVIAKESKMITTEFITGCTVAVTSAWKEPVPGWTNSKNGPTGFMMGAAKGVVRRLPAARDLIYDYIPVDTVINELIVAAWHVGTTRYLNFMLSMPLLMLPHHLLHLALPLHVRVCTHTFVS